MTIRGDHATKLVAGIDGHCRGLVLTERVLLYGTHLAGKCVWISSSRLNSYLFIIYAQTTFIELSISGQILKTKNSQNRNIWVPEGYANTVKTVTQTKNQRRQTYNTEISQMHLFRYSIIFRVTFFISSNYTEDYQLLIV